MYDTWYDMFPSISTCMYIDLYRYISADQMLHVRTGMYLTASMDQYVGPMLV